MGLESYLGRGHLNWYLKAQYLLAETDVVIFWDTCRDTRWSLLPNFLAFLVLADY